MIFEGTVLDGVVRLPTGVSLPDGTPVRVETTPRKRFVDLLDLAGTWAGNDTDETIEEIYRLRSSAPARAPFDA